MAEAENNIGENDVDEVVENSDIIENSDLIENSELVGNLEVIENLPEPVNAHELEHSPELESADLVHSLLGEQKLLHDNDSLSEGAEKKWPGWPGESVFRMLVPALKVGSIIGRKGEFIKKIVEETRARIKILDGPPGTAERAVMYGFRATTQSSIRSQI